MEPVFVGIDVAYAKNKPLPVSMAVRRDNNLAPLALTHIADLKPPRGKGNRAILEPKNIHLFVEEAIAYVRAVATRKNLAISRIAIDAPSGFCSVDQPRRAAETAMDRAGISCFATPSKSKFETIKRKAGDHIEQGRPDNRIPHSNQLWMLVGFALFEGFRQIAECRETFPQAIVRSLGVGDIYKSSPEGFARQFNAVGVATGWSQSGQELKNISFGAQHDKLDAFMCAWVASLDETEMIAFGNPPDDVIWVPRIRAKESLLLKSPSEPREHDTKHKPKAHQKGPASLVNGPVIEDTAGLSADDVVHCAVRCPACHEKVFKRWPGGWDAHAGYKCKGLELSSPQSRKAEFKRRFRDLFK